jgi:ribosomal protein S6--L-glutamate ligase
LTDEHLKVAVVGIKGGWSSELLADRLAERTGFRLLIDFDEVSTNLSTGEVRYGEWDLRELDALVIKKLGNVYSPVMLDRLEILRFLTQGGLRVFSKPQSIVKLIDRLSCTVTLRCASIPMPETAITESVSEAERFVRRFGAAVLKPLYSTKAQGMTLVSVEDADLTAKLQAYRATNPVMYVQRRLPSINRDLGLVFLGGKYIGAYSRVKAPGAWNTTTAAGGRYAHQEVSPEIVDLAQRAQALFDMDLTSVDVVETPAGPLVFEVSAFGGFRGLQDASGVDLGALYADYVLKRLRS